MYTQIRSGRVWTKYVVCPMAIQLHVIVRYLTPLLCTSCYHLEPVPKTTKHIHEFQKTAVGAFAALTIATSAGSASLPANALLLSPSLSSSTMVAEKVVREGVYGEYTIDVQPQKYDDARSTYKAASETKSKKGE
jgi:hypothetical protein